MAHTVLTTFTCTGVHRKGIKLKEAVRLEGLCTLFTKKGRFGLPGTVKREEVTRRDMEGLLEDKGYFRALCFCTLILVLTLCLP